MSERTERSEGHERMRKIGTGMSAAHSARLDRLRGATPPRRHNARTIAALTANPGCTRRAVLDAAGVDKPKLATQVGFPTRFGQSRFALARGVSFEAMLKADGCARLLDLLRDTLDPDRPDANAPELIGAVDYHDLGTDADNTLSARYTRTRALLARSVGAALVDHPLLTLDVAGQRVFLEPDLVAFQVEGRLHVVEIKSFAIVDGQADSAKVSAAAVQAAVYVLALRRLLEECGQDPMLVSHDVVLVCPENFSFRPTAVVLDVRRQLSTLRRQLTRLAAVDDLIAELPEDLSVDLALQPAVLIAGLRRIEARYAPECLSACELSYFCRDEAGDATAALGRGVREALGGVDTIGEALELATGTREPEPDQREAAALLRAAAQLRAEALAEPAVPAPPGPPGLAMSAVTSPR